MHMAGHALDTIICLGVDVTSCLVICWLLDAAACRPWSGVHLSDTYLSSVAAAEGVTAQLLAAYAAGGVVPLVETAVKHDAELEHVLKLLQGDKRTGASLQQAL